MKAENRIELFKGGEPRLGCPGRFDGAVVVDVMNHWDARDRASYAWMSRGFAKSCKGL